MNKKWFDYIHDVVITALLVSIELLITLKQGRLGDCWFLSAVAVLTEVSRISEVIITPEYNEEGIYTVRFCIQVQVPFFIEYK